MTGYARPELLAETGWLDAHLADPDLRILDCTTAVVPAPGGGDLPDPQRATFEAGHVPGAQFVDIQGELSDPDQTLRFMLPTAERFAAAMERLGIGAGTRVVVYSTGNFWWATRVWWLLKVFGFDEAALLNGGFAKWQREGRPIETGPGRSRPPAVFPVRPPLPLVADRAEVLAAIGSAAVCTLNALPPAQHAGTAPSSYGRAGHIAGSRNLPGVGLIDPDSGCLLDAEAITARIAAAGAQGRPVISYCGGGITATALAFAFALTGRDDVRIYDGSMQEWAADPALPMEASA